MFDPYQILGVTREASDDEIKKAYRSLSRKYHPDANINNPNKAEAEEKFKQVQQAYDQIMKEKEQGVFGGFSGYGFGGSQSQQAAGGGSDYENYMRAAANYIQNHHFKEALNVLNAMQERNAMWYYYSAIANHGIGNNVAALEHAKNAAAMEPNNFQYRQLVSQMEGGGSWYREMQSPYTEYRSTGSDLCCKLCIANMMCNLCCPGGGFFCI
ncbi:MAG: DnaJ domain-containing protein [Lachnospiraceae bacterium]